MTNFLMFIATAVIAVYAILSYNLAKQIKNESDKEREKYHKLVIDLITSNMVGKGSHNSTPEQLKNQFVETRKKMTELFVDIN